MDIDKIKNFLILHFEKMILGVIVAMSFFLIYKGTQLPNFLNEKLPEELAKEANEVRLAVDEDHTAAVIDQRRPVGPSSEIVERTKDLYTPVDSTTYKLAKVWVGETSANSVIRRQDPLLLPPLDLRTVPVICSIAAKGAKSADGYALAQLDDADEIKKTEKKKPRRRRPRRKPVGMEGMMGSESGMEGMMGGSPGSMDMMGGPPGGMGAMGPAGPVSKHRTFDQSLSLGYAPASAKPSKSNFPQPKLGWFIAGTALLPHREIYEAYELAFEDAGGYDPTRDTPLYYDFQVQRADVTDKSVADLKEEDWSKAYDRILYTKIAAKVWNGFAPEIVPRDYRDDNITTWIPPVLLDDYGSFALHPKIPRMSKSDLKMAAESDAKANAPTEDTDIDNIDFEDSDTELAGPAGGGFNPDGGAGMMGGGFAGGMGGGGMGMFGRGKIEANPVDYKLIRFYDFGAYPRYIEPGRKYSYRLRYAVVDPNFPANPRRQPSSSQLAPEVAKRVMAKISDTRESGKRNFRLWSDWSEPTLPASLPPFQETFAGSVNPGSMKTFKVAGRDVLVHREASKAKIVISQFDPVLGARVPIMLEAATEGSVLAHTAPTADVIDPISGKIKKAIDYQIQSSAMVVDLGGGLPLGISEGLHSPGEMLLTDSNGNLIFTDDVSDQRDYRVYSFADERE